MCPYNYVKKEKNLSSNVIYSAYFISCPFFLLTHNGLRIAAKSTPLTHTHTLLELDTAQENNIDSSTESHLPPHPSSCLRAPGHSAQPICMAVVIISVSPVRCFGLGAQTHHFMMPRLINIIVIFPR